MQTTAVTRSSVCRLHRILSRLRSDTAELPTALQHARKQRCCTSARVVANAPQAREHRHAARAALLAARTAQLTNRRRASRRGDCLRLRAAAPMRAAERRAACCRRRREAPKTKGKRRTSRRSDGWLRAEGLHNWRRRDAVKNERKGPCASRLRARASWATTGRAESARRGNVHRPGAPRHARSDDEWSTTVHRTAPRGVTSVAD